MISYETRLSAERRWLEDSEGSLRVCLAGMAPDTSNLGVSALCKSVLYGIARRTERLDVLVWDHGTGLRDLELETDGSRVTARCCGAYHTRRIYRAESLWNIRQSARLGGLGNFVAHYLRAADALLDISGGDSFTDLYGMRRFRAVALPKQIALEQHKPLLLLPQTYGPFSDVRVRAEAGVIAQKASMAWARDARSFEVLRELLGEAYDPDRHRLGVDVAFALPATSPSDRELAPISAWIEDRSCPLVGLNVSGLLANRPEEAGVRYGLVADYRAVIDQLLQRLLSKSDCRILLIPHVVAPTGHYESDIEAAYRALNAVDAGARERVTVAPTVNDPCEAKWLISQCAWFCGSRMHSTIAALSTGVPSAAISYSPKTLGVFETCGQGEHVADPCTLNTEDVVEKVYRSWTDREETVIALHRQLPDVLQRANVQFDSISTFVSRAKENSGRCVGDN